MSDKFISLILSLLFFFLAFGEFDPIFGIRAAFNSVDVLIIILIPLIFLLYYEKFLTKLNINLVYLLFILFILYLSSTLYGYSSYEKPSFNFKLLLCIILYYSLVTLYREKPFYIYYSLIAYSIGCLVFIVLLHTVYSSELQFNKGRLLAFGENPNSTSSRLTIAMVFLIYLVLNWPFRIKLLKYLALSLSVPIFYVILQSGSRGSLISVLFSAIILVFFSNIKSSYKLLIILLCILIYPIFISLLSDAGSIYERLVASIQEKDLAGRDEIWSAALDITYRHPLIGAGEAGYFHEVYMLTGKYVDTHNLALYLLATSGVIGFISFCIFYKKIFLNALYYFKIKDVLPMVLLLNVTLISLKTGGSLTYLIMWVIFAMVYAYSYKSNG